VTQLSKRQLLGEAAAWTLFLPVFGSIAILLLPKAIPEPAVLTKLLLAVFVGSGLTAEIVALRKLDRCKTWSFGWAKLTSYLLTAFAFLFLFCFSEALYIVARVLWCGSLRAYC
jgi:hypothetical protein